MAGETALAEALRKLVNEATGFLGMADPETHGHTNITVLRQRIEEARIVLADQDRCADDPCTGGRKRHTFAKWSGSEPTRHFARCIHCGAPRKHPTTLVVEEADRSAVHDYYLATTRLATQNEAHWRERAEAAEAKLAALPGIVPPPPPADQE